MPLYREDLDGAQCSEPGCTHTDCKRIYLTGKCHFAAHTGLTVSYDKTRGVLLLECGECGRAIGDVAVADRPGLGELAGNLHGCRRPS